MDPIIFIFGLMATLAAAMSLLLLSKLLTLRRHIHRLSEIQSHRQAESGIAFETLVKTLRENQEKQAANLSKLAISHLALKQDLLTLEGRIAQGEDGGANPARRPTQLLH